jgi:hypothetical protein
MEAMAAMKQSGTDYGSRHESGEHEPKGVKASDTSGERKDRVPKADSEKGTKGESGEREPKGDKASDSSGERKVRLEGGVGMGKADSIGAREAGHMGKQDGLVGELNTGTKEGHFYHHKRVPHAQG